MCIRLLHSRYTYATIHIYIYMWKPHLIRNGCERVAKVLCVRGELETEQRLQHIDPQFLCL